MLRNASWGLLTTVALAACSPRPGAESAKAPDQALTVKAVMRDQIEPNAQIFWHSSGSIDTLQGSESLVPNTPDGWKKAEESVAAVIDAARQLKKRDLARDRKDWLTKVDALIAQARLAQAATKARNGDDMFLTGGDMYAACTECHKQYLLPLLGPDGRPKKIDENGSPIVAAPR